VNTLRRNAFINLGDIELGLGYDDKILINFKETESGLFSYGIHSYLFN
jgi:hypothetical protein